MPGPSPLVGYNTNVRHKGKLYHIQTEDSGVNHPHVITHLFADGGRIIASRKTGYSEHLGAKELQGIVKKLMQDQHKAMFIELRDCVYDEDQPVTTAPVAAPAVAASPSTTVAAVSPKAAASVQAPASSAVSSARAVVAVPAPKRVGTPMPDIAASMPLDVAAFDRAAEARLAQSATSRMREGQRRGAGRYQQTVPAKPGRGARPPSTPSIFGNDVLRGKSLDEVILSYLSDDVGETER